MPTQPASYSWEATDEEVAARYGIPIDEILRFDLNTSPAPPDLVAAILAAGVFDAPLSEYPPSDYRRLIETAAGVYGVDPDELLVGAGADEILDLVRDDLARRYPGTRTRGRPSAPVEVILRMLVVMRLYSWSYEQAEYFVNDSLVLRQFCRVYLRRVPDDTTLIRWANIIGPETVEAINDRVVQLARSLKVTRGRKLRVASAPIPVSRRMARTRPSRSMLRPNATRLRVTDSAARQACGDARSSRTSISWYSVASMIT